MRYPLDSNLDQELTIRSDGMISLAYIGDIQAAGRSPAELSADLAQRYKNVLKKPELTVIVLKESGRSIFVGGQVRTPGHLPLRANETLSQALFETGGLTTLGREDEVVVIRARLGDAIYVLKADLSRILAGKERDVRLEPFDVVYVPETIIAKLDQFVDQYVNMLIPRAASFPFTTELHTQPIRLIGNQANMPAVQITR